MTSAQAMWRPVRASGGTSIAEIGPIFPPGAETRPHTHPGPEAWYHAAGGVCEPGQRGAPAEVDDVFARRGSVSAIVPRASSV